MKAAIVISNLSIIQHDVLSDGNDSRNVDLVSMLDNSVYANYKDFDDGNSFEGFRMSKRILNDVNRFIGF